MGDVSRVADCYAWRESHKEDVEDLDVFLAFRPWTVEGRRDYIAALAESNTKIAGAPPVLLQLINFPTAYFAWAGDIYGPVPAKALAEHARAELKDGPATSENQEGESE